MCRTPGLRLSACEFFSDGSKAAEEAEEHLCCAVKNDEAALVVRHILWCCLTDRAQAAARRRKIHSFIYARRQLQAFVRQPRPRNGNPSLLCGDQIKLPKRLLIEERPFLAISAAPVFVTTRDPDEIARADAFRTGIIPIQVGASYDDKQHHRRMRVHPCIVSGTKPRKPSERSVGGIAPRHGARDSRHKLRVLGCS